MAQGGDAASRRRMMIPLQQDSIDPDQLYPMNLPRLGHAVIVNNIATEMPGSLRDVEALKAAYKTIGFDVQVHNDCSAQEMRKINKWIMNDDNHIDSNCFALTIISHGNDNWHLFDKNRKNAWDTELFLADLSDVETVIGKPKIIVIQACRSLQFSEGKASQAHILPDEPFPLHILQDKPDMFLAYATVPGYRADAGTENGSTYLQALAKYLKQEYMRRPLDKILKMVRQHMIRKVQGASCMKQCPEERNSLIYDVMFSEFHQEDASTSQILSQKQQREIEKQKRKLEEEFKKEFKNKEAVMATKMRHTEEERRAMEANMSSRTEELEAMMKQMKQPSQIKGVGVFTDTEFFKNPDVARKKAEDEAWKLYNAGSYDEALIKVELALEIEEKELGARDERMAHLYRLLATVCYKVNFTSGAFITKENLDMLRKIMMNCEKAVIIYRRLPRDILYKRSLGNVLTVYIYALTHWSRLGGDERLSAEEARDKANSTVEEVITIAKQTNDMRLLAEAYKRKGDILDSDESAVTWYNEALRIAKEHLGGKDELCRAIYFNTGIYYEDRKDFEKAYDNFKQSYLIYKEVNGDEHPETQKALAVLQKYSFSVIAKKRGEKW